MDAQMKKGVLEMCVLSVVARGECYGYEVARQLRTFDPEINESTIYAILRRYHADGAVEVFYGTVSSGPKRKYYRITELGRQRLAAARSEWRRMVRVVEELCYTEEA